MIAAASWRELSLSAVQDAPAAAATCAPGTCAPRTSCGFKERSMMHTRAPARASTSAMKRASLPFVFSVANSATAGCEALTGSLGKRSGHPAALGIDDRRRQWDRPRALAKPPRRPHGPPPYQPIADEQQDR